MRRHRMRSNPARLGGTLKGVVGILKQAAPVAAGFYLSRIAVGAVETKMPAVVDTVLNKLGSHKKPVVSILVALGVNFLGGKVRAISKYRSGLVLGAGLNAVDTLVRSYMPASIAGLIGAGDYYDQLEGYQYDTGDYVETSDYVETGAEEELGDAEYDLAFGDDDLEDEGMEDGGLGAFGCPPSPMLKTLPAKAPFKPAFAKPGVSAIKKLSATVAVRGMQKGVFAKGCFD